MNRAQKLEQFKALVRAKLEDRPVVLVDAVRALELDVFRWPAMAQRRRMFMVWASGDGQFHAEVVQKLARLTKFC